MLKDRISEFEWRAETMSTSNEDQSSLTEQLETERRTSNELREALDRSEAGESELTELERLRVEEE